MQDLRLTKRLTDYWNRLRDQMKLPQWEKFNISGLSDVWGQCCVWRVDIDGIDGGSARYTYEYVGNDTQQALGRNMTGLVFVSHTQKFPGARITERISEVVETGRPVSDEGSFVNEKNKVVKYRSCLLPFGTQEGRVTRIVLGLSWKMF